MKKVKLFIITFVLLISFAGIGFCENRTYALGTAGAGGTFNYVGSVVANFVTEKLDDFDMRAITTGGSNVNVRLLKEGEIDFGMANGLSLYLAYEGKGIWEGKAQKNLRALTRTHAAAIHYIVDANSGIKTFKDLIGKKGNTDVVGGTTRLIHEDICKYAGVDNKLIPEVNVDYVQALDLFRDNHIQWFMASGSVPEANVTEIAFTRNIDNLDVGGELRDRMVKEIPYYFPVTIPSGTYKGIDRPIETIVTVVAIFCDESVPDDIAYKLTKAIHDNVDELRKLHVGLSDLSVDNAAGGLGIPLHPGSIKYFNEVAKKK